MTTYDDRASLTDLTATAERVRRSVEGVIEGKPEVVRLSLTVLLAEGHLLIEDVPGVGKTMLAKALARSIDCSVRRIQFTPDLLPSDITGVSHLRPAAPGLRVQAGRDLRADRDRRRDQPRLAEDPVRAAGVDGGAPGHHRRADLRTAQPLHGGGHPEPGGDGGHLPAARGPARPLHGPGVHRLPQRGGRAADARRARRRLPAGRPPAGGARPRHREAHRGGPRRSTSPKPVRRYAVDLVAATRTHPDLRLGASPRATLHLLRAREGLRRARAAGTTRCRTTSRRSPWPSWPTGCCPPPRPSSTAAPPSRSSRRSCSAPRCPPAPQQQSGFAHAAAARPRYGQQPPRRL